MSEQKQCACGKDGCSCSSDSHGCRGHGCMCARSHDFEKDDSEEKEIRSKNKK